jgi:hypothetical protein
MGEKEKSQKDLRKQRWKKRALPLGKNVSF